MANTTESSSVRVVDRTLDIIEALAGAPHGMQLNALSEAVGLHKATVYRLLQSLANRCYVVKDEETGKYRLTMRLFDLSSQILGGSNLLGVARPFLERISDEAHEVVHLVVRENTEVVYLCKEDPCSSVVQMSSRIGSRIPLYCTGVGKSILAGLGDEELEEVWQASNVVPRTYRTITTLEDMRRELEEVRRRGYAVDDEENEVGVRCVRRPSEIPMGSPSPPSAFQPPCSGCRPRPSATMVRP